MRQILAPLLIFGLCAACPVLAEPAPPPPEVKDFTFKRVGVPKSGAGKRITVQIDPEEQAAFLAASAAAAAAARANPLPPIPDPGTATAPGSPSFDWYWTAVSPNLKDAGQGRFAEAVLALDKAPEGKGVNSPRLKTLQGIADAHGAEILKATIGTRVSPALVLAVIAVESGGNAAAKSSAGASGLMQLMPDTATRFGVTEATDPTQSIKGGVAYLDWLMGEFGSDAVLALAGYNAGEGAVRKNAGVPPYAETRGYVPKVLAAWRVARGLCLTPPELPGDGCVFVARRQAANG
jgi:soluble lytic murein transglycosylase-like protein